MPYPTLVQLALNSLCFFVCTNSLCIKFEESESREDFGVDEIFLLSLLEWGPPKCPEYKGTIRPSTVVTKRKINKTHEKLESQYSMRKITYQKPK